MDRDIAAVNDLQSQLATAKHRHTKEGLILHRAHKNGMRLTMPKNEGFIDLEGIRSTASEDALNPALEAETQLSNQTPWQGKKARKSRVDDGLGLQDRTLGASDPEADDSLKAGVDFSSQHRRSGRRAAMMTKSIEVARANPPEPEQSSGVAFSQSMSCDDLILVDLVITRLDLDGHGFALIART